MRVYFFTIGDFPIQFSIYTSCRTHYVLWTWEDCGLSRSCFTTGCRRFLIWYLKLLWRAIKVVSINNVCIWTPFVQRASKPSLRRRQKKKKKRLHNSEFISPSGMPHFPILISLEITPLPCLNVILCFYLYACCKKNSWNLASFSCFYFRWGSQFSHFPVPWIQGPQEIFNCHGKYFSRHNLRETSFSGEIFEIFLVGHRV